MRSFSASLPWCWNYYIIYNLAWRHLLLSARLDILSKPSISSLITTEEEERLLARVTPRVASRHLKKRIGKNAFQKPKNGWIHEDNSFQHWNNSSHLLLHTSDNRSTCTCGQAWARNTTDRIKVECITKWLQKARKSLEFYQLCHCKYEVLLLTIFAKQKFHTQWAFKLIFFKNVNEDWYLNLVSNTIMHPNTQQQLA